MYPAGNLFIPAPHGKLEAILKPPRIDPTRGVSLVLHPHTLSGGTMFAESGTGTQNTFAGPVTLSGASGGTFDANSNAVLNVSGAIGGTDLP